MPLLLVTTALAADNPPSPPLLQEMSVEPHAWVRPGFSWIEDEPSNPTAQDGFVLEARAGVDASVRVLDRTHVKAKVELALLPEPVLTDAYVAVNYGPWVTLRLGQVKIPFSIHRLSSDTRRVLIPSVRMFEAAAITREIGGDVTLALPIAGETRVAFTSGIYNGEGANRIQNVNQRFQLAQRGLVTPFGTRASPFEGTTQGLYLGIGGGWLYDYSGDGEGAAETNTFGLDLQFAWNVLSFQAEVMDHEVVNANVAVSDYHVQGAYGQIASFLPVEPLRRHVELAARYEIVDPNTSFGAAAGEATPELQASQRITGGLNLYLSGEAVPAYHDLKMQLAYTHVEAFEGEELPDDVFSTTVTARF